MKGTSVLTTRLVGTAAAMLLASSVSAQPGTNLLDNGDAEAGDTSSWTVTDNVEAVTERTQSSGTVQPAGNNPDDSDACSGGEYFFSMAGDDEATEPGPDPATMEQTVDVSGFGGAAFMASACLHTEADVNDGDGTEPDSGRLEIKFFDADDNQVGPTFEMGSLTSIGAWGETSFTGQIPSDAVSAQLTAVGELNDGSFINVFWDELSLAYGAIIDIKPGSDPNSINLGSRGVVPVAVLGDEEFNPAEEVDFSSFPVMFAGAEAERCSVEDVNSDGIQDLICHFRTQALDLTPESTEACLTATLNDDDMTEFTGCDSVRIVPPQSPGDDESEDEGGENNAQDHVPAFVDLPPQAKGDEIPNDDAEDKDDNANGKGGNGKAKGLGNGNNGKGKGPNHD